jgi:hypothetical protein
MKPTLSGSANADGEKIKRETERITKIDNQTRFFIMKSSFYKLLGVGKQTAPDGAPTGITPWTPALGCSKIMLRVRRKKSLLENSGGNMVNM